MTRPHQFGRLNLCAALCLLFSSCQNGKWQYTSVHTYICVFYASTCEWVVESGRTGRLAG